jgi:hypothetical protein
MKLIKIIYEINQSDKLLISSTKLFKSFSFTFNYFFTADISFDNR